MRVGVIGLGKLGLPVALALEQAGHKIYGCEASPSRVAAIVSRTIPELDYEPHLAEYLDASEVVCGPVDRMAEWEPDVILVTVQTPHAPEFEGVTPLESKPQDFDYTHLKAAVAEVGEAFEYSDHDPLVVIVSTCLPGTFEREIRPLADAFGMRMAYHPLFIAMGSVIEDFRNPEFVLVGSAELSQRDAHARSQLVQMYAPVLADPPGCDSTKPPFRFMSITSAELTKVAYNAAIGFKLLLANTVAELSDKVGANCDDVMDTLKLATKRLVSTAYMTPGMGDGGGCHPRDQIALSWLADRADLSSDPFGMIVWAREEHAKWLAAMWVAEGCKKSMPLVMLGEEYKANTSLTTGSHARLVGHYLDEWGRVYHVDRSASDVARQSPSQPCCYFLSCPHDWALSATLPEGSVVVDPWGMFPEREGVEVVRPGRRA